jgi:hypothetical protein
MMYLKFFSHCLDGTIDKMSVGQLRGGGGESVVTVLKQLCFF